mmetsp:Transcript_25510/g.47106  ORF Transcript_25510/g.47106 Transcript_25510/m.47106 type:complete len:195 (+) Transcript_25510:614-1198(+)
MQCPCDSCLSGESATALLSLLGEAMQKYSVESVGRFLKAGFASACCSETLALSGGPSAAEPPWASSSALVPALVRTLKSVTGFTFTGDATARAADGASVAANDGADTNRLGKGWQFCGGWIVPVCTPLGVVGALLERGVPQRRSTVRSSARHASSAAIKLTGIFGTALETGDPDDRHLSEVCVDDLLSCSRWAA